MNEREVSELRRRFRPDKTNITKLCGCYVSDKGEILAQFTQSVNLIQGLPWQENFDPVKVP